MKGHTPTNAMKSAAQRGVQMAKDATVDPTILAAGKKVAAGQKLSDDHVHAIAEFHGAHECQGDCEDLLMGGMPGAIWSASRASAIASTQLSAETPFLELFGGEKAISFELFSENNLDEPVKLGPDENGWIWSPILRSGMTMTRPGPGGQKIPEPLVFLPGHSENQQEAIGLQDLVDAFHDLAIQHVTIPTSHDNRLVDNTGFIKDLRIIDSKARPGEKVLMAGHNFTEPDVRGKVERGTIANRSCGLLYDYTNPTSGKQYPIVLDHVALTNSPWVHGMPAYGDNTAEFGDRTIISVGLSDNIVSAPAPVPTPGSVVDGLRFAPKNESLSTHDAMGKLKTEFGVELADVQWGDTPSLNSIRGQVTGALSKLRLMAGPENQNGPPYYWVRDVTAEKALINVEYGGSDPEDAWVVPFSVGSNGEVTLSAYKDWIPVEQQWVTDEDAAADKNELETILQMSELTDAEKLELATLTAKKRSNIDKSNFVFPAEAPGSGSYPIPDLAHARNALARSSGKPEEGAVKKAVYAKFPELKSGSKKTPDKSTKMGELPDDPLKRASTIRLSSTTQTTAPQGGTMKITEEQMTTLGLSDEAKEIIRRQNAAIDQKDQDLAVSRATTRVSSTQTRLGELKALGFDAFPGFLKEVESVMLSDNGDVAIALNLSENGIPQNLPQTATQIVDRLIAALPVKDGKVALGEQGKLLETPPSARPAQTAEEAAGTTAPKTADAMLAEWARDAGPAVLGGLSAPANTSAVANGATPTPTQQ